MLKGPAMLYRGWTAFASLIWKVLPGYQGKKDLIAVDAQGRQLDVEISPEVVEVKATVGYPEKELI